MILTKSKDIHISIHYTEKVQGSENLELSDTCATIFVTKDMIPTPFYMSYTENWESREITNYNIKLLQGVNLHISDAATAHTLFEILSDDFYDVDLKRDHPDLFL